MKGTYLGEFEELVLLAVAVINGQAYGVVLKSEMEKHTGRKISLSSIHTALYRLEKKGFVQSNMTTASKVRGGRRKRVYSITASGHQALVNARSLRDSLWTLIPDLKF